MTSDNFVYRVYDQRMSEYDGEVFLTKQAALNHIDNKTCCDYIPDTHKYRYLIHKFTMFRELTE
jgi:hypothetical protein